MGYWVLVTVSFLQSCSPGSLPQNPQASPSLFKKGLWLAHVPANSPFFFPQILIAIPANASANNPIVTSANFMIQLLHKGTKYLAKARNVQGIFNFRPQYLILATIFSTEGVVLPPLGSMVI